MSPDYDAHIESPRYAQDWLKILHADPDTGEVIHRWEAYGRREYGEWSLVNEDDWNCPECGAKGDRV